MGKGFGGVVLSVALLAGLWGLAGCDSSSKGEPIVSAPLASISAAAKNQQESSARQVELASLRAPTAIVVTPHAQRATPPADPEPSPASGDPESVREPAQLPADLLEVAAPVPTDAENPLRSRDPSRGEAVSPLRAPLQASPGPASPEAPSPQPSSQPGPLQSADPKQATALPPQKQPLQPVGPPQTPATEEANWFIGPDGLRHPKSAKRTGEPFDPIKENGEIFAGWPKPKLALVITGRQDGYIEPCGCAGMERMKGGMARRATLFKKLRGQGWPVVGLDVGGIAKGFGPQAELKFHTMIDGMLKMGYDAIGFGVSDLRLPVGDLVSVAANPPSGPPTPFVSANVGLISLDSGIPAKLRMVNAGGARLGITAVIGKSWLKQVTNADVQTMDPAEALKALLPQLMKQANYPILLAYATVDESEALAKQFPQFKVVVAAGEVAEPPADYKVVPGTKTMLMQVGEKGMCAIVLAYFEADQKPQIRYQRVTLDSRFDASPDMKLLMRVYQDQLKARGFAGLSIRPIPNPQKDVNGRYVGSKKCESCHEESPRIWKKTTHSHALETLAKLDPPRQYDPECLSCHVVGWNPQKFFPYESGYLSQEKTPELTDVGCENCHGPGESHCIAEAGRDLKLQEQLRKAVRITKEECEKRFCTSTCHDLDNSPDFKFPIYWPVVEHYEK